MREHVVVLAEGPPLDPGDRPEGDADERVERQDAHEDPGHRGEAAVGLLQLHLENYGFRERV